ncbi:hypothetical protein BC831DRAFT_4158 [Entophlyctis helioformis]|nr:hypothetical protein BC831DRAFT_4158 [Entophlyctis helioformis]
MAGTMSRAAACATTTATATTTSTATMATMATMAATVAMVAPATALTSRRRRQGLAHGVHSCTETAPCPLTTARWRTSLTMQAALATPACTSRRQPPVVQAARQPVRCSCRPGPRTTWSLSTLLTAACTASKSRRACSCGRRQPTWVRSCESLTPAQTRWWTRAMPLVAPVPRTQRQTASLCQSLQATAISTFTVPARA